MQYMTAFRELTKPSHILNCHNGNRSSNPNGEWTSHTSGFNHILKGGRGRIWDKLDSNFRKKCSTGFVPFRLLFRFACVTSGNRVLIWWPLAVPRETSSFITISVVRSFFLGPQTFLLKLTF